jgi:hypothetical protein
LVLKKHKNLGVKIKMSENSNVLGNIIFNHPYSYCPYCSDPPHSFSYHTGSCPRMKAIEYYPDGKVKRIEFADGTVNYGLDSAVDLELEYNLHG